MNKVFTSTTFQFDWKWHSNNITFVGISIANQACNINLPPKKNNNHQKKWLNPTHEPKIKMHSNNKKSMHDPLIKFLPPKMNRSFPNKWLDPSYEPKSNSHAIASRHKMHIISIKFLSP
jgi:hypothetical protein